MLLGQSEKGAIVGNVTDTNGAVVPGATVTITDLGTNTSQTYTTNSDGLYEAPFLTPATYKVSVTASGFSTSVANEVVITVGQRQRVDVKLQPGNVTALIQVTDVAPLLQTESASIGQVIDSKTITELPSANRNIYSFLLLNSNVTQPGGRRWPCVPPGNRWVRFWHDQIFYKPAHHGGVVIWHQDYSYWTRTQPMAHLSCWIGLDDSTRENGCVHYVPGSHRWDVLPRENFANDMDTIKGVLTEAQMIEFKPVAIELKKGECSFHHPLMVHGSFENRTDQPRRAAVINVFRDGVYSASDEHLLQGVPPISMNRKIEGQFFPLLFDPRALEEIAP